MKKLQNALVVTGIVLFLLVGIAMLLFLFTDVFFWYGDTIAVIGLSGDISGPQAIRNAFDEALEDQSVVGVILYINSAGGGIIETKEIASSLAKLAEVKPVVAYIADVGASGAYYIATFADYIMADENSLIGGIGVISTCTIYKDLLEEKLGINTTVIKSGKFKDIGSPYRPMTQEEKERLQEIVDTVNRRFTNAIATRRGLSKSALERISTADIFLGDEAMEMGLVDYLGGFDDAVGLVRRLSHNEFAEARFIELDDYQEAGMYYEIGRGLGDALANRIDFSDMPLRV